MNSLEQKRKNRFKYLHLLYEKSGGDELNEQDMWEIGEKLGFDKKETEIITQYLKGEYLLEYASLGGGIAITHDGVKEIEDALSHPEQPTQYFPPFNIINIHHMQNSQIQQGTSFSSQKFSMDISIKNEIESFLKILKGKLTDLDLDKDDKLELESDISTIEAQLSSSRPKNSILRECLSSIQGILEGVASSVIAQQLLPLIPPIFASL